MNNQKIIQVGSTFLKEYLVKIEEMLGKNKITKQEASLVQIFGENTINIWRGLFLDKSSPFSYAKLPAINEDSFDGIMKAFAYFIFAELDEIFHTYNSPFQDNSVKSALAPLLTDISREKIISIVSEAIGGEDTEKYLLECEKMIITNRGDAKNPEDEIVKKYLLGIQIMFDDVNGNLLKITDSKTDVEKIATEIYKNNMINFVSSTGAQSKVQNNELSPEEKQHLNDWVAQIEAGEMEQVKDLISNCDSTFQFAKTHSVYIKDWEKTKQKMEENLRNGILPPGVSANLHRAIIDETEKIIQKKLEMVRSGFQKKFGESIYNYLGPDGKTKKLFGIFG